MTASAAFLRDVKLRRRPCEVPFSFVTFLLGMQKKSFSMNKIN